MIKNWWEAIHSSYLKQVILFVEHDKIIFHATIPFFEILKYSDGIEKIQLKDTCTLGDISKYLLSFASVISNCTYTNGMFDHSALVIDINTMFKVSELMEDKRNINSNRFIEFILEIDKVVTVCNNYEHSYSYDNEQLEIALNKLDKVFIIDFHANNHMIAKKESKIKELTKSITDIESILITLKENNISLTKEIYNNKITINDSHVRQMLVTKLKGTDEKMTEYEREKIRIINDIKLIRDECNNMITKRNNDCISYYEIERNMLSYNNKVYTTISQLDNIYINTITAIMKKYNLLITDYLQAQHFNKIVKYAIENLKVLFDTYDLGFTLDVIKNCFLNCNYSESETVRNVHYVGNNGADIYKTQKFQPGFSLKIKSFKMIHFIINNLEKLNELNKRVKQYKENIRLTSNAEEQKKLLIKIIPLLYSMSKTIFEIMYGYFGITTNNVIFKGLYERGVISNKVYLNEFQHTIYLRISGKEKDKNKLKIIYMNALKNLYNLLSVIHLKDIEKVGNLLIHIQNVRNFLSDVQPIELYNASIIHHKINKRMS